jgi:hypothetical protein
MALSSVTDVSLHPKGVCGDPGFDLIQSNFGASKETASRL